MFKKLLILSLFLLGTSFGFSQSKDLTREMLENALKKVGVYNGAQVYLEGTQYTIKKFKVIEGKERGEFTIHFVANPN